jgi:hypothetical protein
MAISYPLALPSMFKVARITLRQNGVVGESVSPFSAEQQIYVHQGQWWSAEIQLPKLARDDAEDFAGWLFSLRGKEGSFLMGDPSAATPRGSAGGTPLVDGAGQTGLTLAVKGGPLSTTNWLKAGDYIQLGTGSSSRLHKVLVAASTDGAGKATLDIWPRLRSSPADGAAIVVSAAKGLWMLASNASEYEIEPAMQYGFSFACRERL